jgi:hypothetical protein
MDDEEQRRLALELRAGLEAVVSDEDEREAVAKELDAALALPGPEGDRRLTDVLAAREETRTWMRERDPDRVDTERLVELLGLPTMPLGTYLVCPEGDFDFVREAVGQEVPLCPVHHLQLIPQPD